MNFQQGFAAGLSEIDSVYKQIAENDSTIISDISNKGSVADLAHF
jgi:hypothetical protein